MLASTISLPWATKASAWFMSSLVMLDTPLSPFRLLKSFQLSVCVAYVALYYLANFWLGHVTETVREPYLDEVFHIPQSQAYCSGRYDVWDPKLTTPPGLYILATLYAKASAYGKCSVSVLRSFNVLSLVMVFSYACDCRALISRIRRRSPEFNAANVAFQMQRWTETSKHLSADEIHTALNIALFPLLFFFSGLFYTDILSTCVVLRMYRLFLERRGAYENSGEGLIWLYLTGIAALWMRQTNIFWVAVFMGGLELVRTIEANQTSSPSSPKTEATPHNWQQFCVYYFKRYSRGQIHDVELKTAAVHDFALCAISIAIAAAYHPLLIITRLWPYIGLLVSFAGFVFWNGGVVLGDKSNHVATIHLPQMLYIWPFIAFFSAPLIISVGIFFLSRTVKLLSVPLFPRLIWQYLLVGAYSALALVATLAIIKFNTIIHPFTLADNRHYMFYIFRYTILRHPLIRYFAAPVYLLCGYLVYITLCPQSSIFLTGTLKRKQSSETLNEELQSVVRNTGESEGPKTSFVLTLLVTTALSLITAPLVEPRYFILPWVIWRLNVPSLPFEFPKSKGKSGAGGHQLSQQASAWIRFWGWEGHDYRLWFETAWFLLINAITGYMFLYRGFQWKQEPGNVQRFMW